MRNMLQLNQGLAEDGNLRFSEIGQLVGISNADWIEHLYLLILTTMV